MDKKKVFNCKICGGLITHSNFGLEYDHINKAVYHESNSQMIAVHTRHRGVKKWYEKMLRKADGELIARMEKYDGK